MRAVLVLVTALLLAGARPAQSISVERADLLDLDALVWFSAVDEMDSAVRTYGSPAVSREGRDVFCRRATRCARRSRTRPC